MKKTIGRQSTRTPEQSGLRREEGSVLAASVLSLSMLIILVTAFLGTVQQSSVRQSSAVNDKEADYLARAAVAEAITAIRAGASGGIATAGDPAYMGAGVIWVETTDLGGGQTQVVASAMKGKGRSSYQAIVETTGGSLWSRGVSSLADILIKTDGKFDAYDSDLGTYASQILPGNDYALGGVTLATNSDMSLNSSDIHGDANPGPSGTLTAAGGVTGSTAPLAQTFSLDPVAVPALPAGGALVVPNNGSVTLPPGDYRFSSVDVGKGGDLTIQDPSTVVIDDTFDMAKDAVLTVGGSGSGVNIYVGGDMYLATKTTILTPDEKPETVGFYFFGPLGQTVDLQPHSNFFGTLYGPNTYFDMGTKVDFHGAIAGREIYFQPHARFHFDLALTRLGGGATQTSLLHWEETAFPVQEHLTDRRDPFRVLGVKRDSLRSPAAAWHP